MDGDLQLAANAGPAIEDLCRRYGVARLDLFGSAARGDAKPGSDLDFLVTFNDDPGQAYADAFFGLRTALATLFGTEIDLVAEAAVENPYLRREIEIDRKRIFPPS